MILAKIKSKLRDTTGMSTGISFGIALSAYLEKQLKTKEISDSLDKAGCNAAVKEMVLRSFEKLFDNSRKVLFPDIDRRTQWFTAITATYASHVTQLSSTSALTPELEASFADIEQSMTAGAVMVSVVAYELVKTKAHISLQEYIVQERPDLIPRYASLLERDVALRANKQVWTQWEMVSSLYDSQSDAHIAAVWHNLIAPKSEQNTPSAAATLPPEMFP